MSGTINTDRILDDQAISARIDRHDDPDHADANTVAGVREAFAAMQRELLSGIDQHTEYHEVVHEDRSVIVYDMGDRNDDVEIVFDELDIDDEPLREILGGLMHDLARDYCDHDWASTYPLVIQKDTQTRRAEAHVRQRLGQLVVGRGGAARGLDYWATKVQGLTFSQWERESGRSTGAIGNSIRRGKKDAPEQ